MRRHVPVIAAILVPLLALEPSCARVPRELRLTFDGEEGVVEAHPTSLWS